MADATDDEIAIRVLLYTADKIADGDAKKTGDYLLSALCSNIPADNPPEAARILMLYCNWIESYAKSIVIKNNSKYYDHNQH